MGICTTKCRACEDSEAKGIAVLRRGVNAHGYGGALNLNSTKAEVKGYSTSGSPPIATRKTRQALQQRITKQMPVQAQKAGKTAGADIEGMDVATLDAARVAKLKAVFEDITAITSRVEEIDHPGDGEDDPGWRSYILHITITPRAPMICAQPMRSRPTKIAPWTSF